MLRALGDPVSFLVLLASFVVAVTAHGWAQTVVAGGAGPVGGARRVGPLRWDPRRQLDPFGSVAGLLAGVGWGSPPEAPDRRRRGRLVAVLLAGPTVNLGLGVAALVGFRLLGGGGLPLVTSALLQYGATGGGAAVRGLLLFGLMNLYVGLLSLVPLPPLDGGRLLLGLGPRSAGWQKAEYHLVEQNLGVVALLVLLLVPLGGSQALLPVLLDLVASPIVSLVTGG